MATILAIDDDRDILVIVEQALKAGGHRVITACDPASAPALAAAHHVDAVVLDIQMPDLSGYEVLRALRGQPRTGGVPILFLSALADSKDRIRGLREGADDYLGKPFAPEELLLRVERLLGQRSGVSGAPLPLAADLEEKLSQRRVVGQVFMGRYKVLERVGEGAMGLVFRGWDPKLKRPVALKTMRLERLTTERDRGQMIARLLAEAVTVARFSHPNIVAVYDVAEGPRSAFIAMEYIDGTSLEGYLEIRGRLPPGQVLPLALGVASGLAAAHAHRIVHRDVKPGNVLLGVDGSIKVTDFGVAQLVSSLAAPGEGSIFGTPGYLPPEALLDEPLTETGDLFGLGAVLYECLTGKRAFAGDTFHKRMVATVKDDVIPPRVRAPEIPADLERLVMDLLVKDPAQRPASADEVVARLTAMGARELVWQPEAEAMERTVGQGGSSGSRLVAPLAL